MFACLLSVSCNNTLMDGVLWRYSTPLAALNLDGQQHKGRLSRPYFILALPHLCNNIERNDAHETEDDTFNVPSSGSWLGHQ